MPRKGKLLAALDAHKGRDYELERQRRLQKAAGRRKRERQAQQQVADTEMLDLAGSAAALDGEEEGEEEEEARNGKRAGDVEGDAVSGGDSVDQEVCICVHACACALRFWWLSTPALWRRSAIMRLSLMIDFILLIKIDSLSS
jgi:hypothetical protein